MTPLATLIDEVHATGAELVVIGGAVKLIGDRSRVSPDLRVRLHDVRDALREHLGSYPCVGCGRHRFPDPGQTCYWCLHPDTRTRGTSGQP